MPKLKRPIDAALAMEFYQKGMTDRQISEALGVGLDTVRKWRYRAGLVSHRPPLVKPSRLDADGKGMELYRQGLSDREIGAAFDMTASAVRDWRLRRGLKANRAPTQPPKRLSAEKAAVKAGPLFMTDDEIRASWRRAASWREQVKILAELNACPVEQMQEKLIELGCLQEVDS